VVPRGPVDAKGLLLASIRDRNPVIFLEPKLLYRSAVEQVPVGDYEIPLGKAAVIREGADVTLVGWGAQLQLIQEAANLAQEKGISAEVIDLRTLLPWDADAVVASVQKTGRLIVSHEAPVTSGFGAEIAATVQERCLEQLLAPVQRVCGWDTPFPLAFERVYMPSPLRILDAIDRAIAF